MLKKKEERPSIQGALTGHNENGEALRAPKEKEKGKKKFLKPSIQTQEC
jgi:hypothetical protein